MGPRPPDSQSVLEPTGRFVPHDVSKALKQIGVNRTALLLENTTIGLRSDTRSRERVCYKAYSLGRRLVNLLPVAQRTNAFTGGCPPGCRFAVTRDSPILVGVNFVV